MPTEHEGYCIRNYKADYEAELKRNEMLEENYKKCKEECESQFDKNLELNKENRKLKTIIAKLLEEKYCKDGD